MRFYSSFLLIISVILMISCKQAPKPTSDTPTDGAEVKVVASDFNVDSAYNFIKQQASFGPRVPNTPAHEKCAVWLEKTMKKYTKDVKVQSFEMKAFNGTPLRLKNIIGTFNPTATTRILLLSHWDSRPFADNDPDVTKHRTPIDGVNDGASGVGVLLEAARQFSIKAPAVGVDILFVDGEDYGAPQNEKSEIEDDWALGAQYWARNPHVPAYSARFGILLDMVGAEGATFTLEGTSMYFAPDIMNNVWRIAAKLGYTSYFVPENSNAITDDHVYINQLRQVPTIDIIQHDPSTESGFYKHWHTIKDDMAGIDKNTLRAVGETVVTTVYLEK
ncbi:MAG: M28 family peptidase [Bacteroidales bacterium]|nr:M28 family peptidase [Bacteroidales bacterium]